MPSYPAKKCANKIKLTPPPDQDLCLINEYLFIYLFFHIVIIFLSLFLILDLSPPPCVARCPDQVPILGGRI